MHRWRSAALTVPVAWLAPAVANACSGPNAMETMMANERVGMLSWLATIVLTVVCASWLRRRGLAWRSLWPLPLLVAVHPGWWMSSKSGDCGFMLRDSSMVATLVALLVLGVMTRRKPPVAREGTDSAAAP